MAPENLRLHKTYSKLTALSNDFFHSVLSSIKHPRRKHEEFKDKPCKRRRIQPEEIKTLRQMPFKMHKANSIPKNRINNLAL